MTYRKSVGAPSTFHHAAHVHAHPYAHARVPHDSPTPKRLRSTENKKGLSDGVDLIQGAA
jgi:hypothetical protein